MSNRNFISFKGLILRFQWQPHIQNVFQIFWHFKLIEFCQRCQTCNCVVICVIIVITLLVMHSVYLSSLVLKSWTAHAFRWMEHLVAQRGASYFCILLKTVAFIAYTLHSVWPTVLLLLPFIYIHSSTMSLHQIDTQGWWNQCGLLDLHMTQCLNMWRCNYGTQTNYVH